MTPINPQNHERQQSSGIFKPPSCEVACYTPITKTPLAQPNQKLKNKEALSWWPYNQLPEAESRMEKDGEWIWRGKLKITNFEHDGLNRGKGGGVPGCLMLFRIRRIVTRLLKQELLANN